MRQLRGELRERFYRSVAETLTLLHAAPGYDRGLAMVEIARVLASRMGIPLVWIGRREPDRLEVDVEAAAGSAAHYASSLRLSADENAQGGRGPVGIVLREERARAVSIDAPEFATWREAAQHYGLGSCIVAASRTADGGQLVLAAYSSETGPVLSDELVDWAQRLVDELARFWDEQGLLERNLRMSRYRDAQRTIQRALLDQPNPEAVYRTLAQALVEIAGAAAVDVYAVDGNDPLLCRVALVGPMADAMHLLPRPPIFSEGPTIFTPTRAFMGGGWPLFGSIRAASQTCPLHGARNPSRRWVPLLAGLFLGGATSEKRSMRKPAGVFAIVTREPDAFDAEMCRLLDEIADATGLALRQHEQRRAMLLEKERQTYLALHDVMTDLPNRRALDHHLDSVLMKVERRRRRHLVALGLLDLDDFKPINDRYGHATGDRILTEVAARLRHSLRSEDYVARLGGDEFVLVFENLEREQDLEPQLARIWSELHKPMVIDDAVFQLSASLGIALSANHTKSSGEQLLRRADQAMYHVKSRKRDRAKWWSVQSPTEGTNGTAIDHDGYDVPPLSVAERIRVRDYCNCFA
nr:sensor domain-containing diguanylate cyclase [Rhodanobacter sp. MP7CTX1]